MAGLDAAKKELVDAEAMKEVRGSACCCETAIYRSCCSVSALSIQFSAVLLPRYYSFSFFSTWKRLRLLAELVNLKTKRLIWFIRLVLVVTGEYEYRN